MRTTEHGHADHAHHTAPGGQAKDPVCGMTVVPGGAGGGSAEHAGQTYWFCNPGCRQKFVADPTRYVSPAPAMPAPASRRRGSSDERIYTCPMHPEVRQKGPGTCPKCGMALEPEMALSAEEEVNPELVDMTHRFWVSLVLTIPVLAIAMSEMLLPGLTGRLDATWRLWLQLVLATPVVLWGGWPFFVRGWQSIVNRSLNMFTLIALGTGAAFGFSVFAVLAPTALPHSMRHGGAPAVYFEAAAVIVTLVLLG
jgi:P-type Cu+ transporter